MSVPLATYRLQFNADFTFRDARAIIDYLSRLGIGDLYSSPLLRARTGSTHGYDIVDAQALNPELGSDEDFANLCADLRRNGMGLLLDIVPNHMAASHENAWWMDVLENGQQSRYLHYFDIDWSGDQVLLPILGRPYGETLESGEIRLAFDEGGFFLSYYDKRLPLSPQSYRMIASETINYRRFFDITDLVGVRVENPEVFEARNRFVFDLISEGKATGIRVDHIDGLYDPVNYLSKLQFRLGDPATEEPGQFYIVVEKILGRGETLPPLRCAGTTGYDFLAAVNDVLVDPEGVARLDEIYRAYSGIGETFDDVVYRRKKQVIDELFYGEMRALGDQLGRLAVADRNARDFAPSELLSALVEITACMPVYRTYIREAPVGDSDRDVIRRAVAEARRRARDVDVRLFNFLELVLLLDPPRYIAEERDKWLDLVMGWQQFTPRVMAKGVEDTAFYEYNRLVSLSEVGCQPGRSGEVDPVGDFHARNERIAREWPHTLNTTSTHDTKRSEDVRARIDVLSEMPDRWERELRRWTKLNAAFATEGLPGDNILAIVPRLTSQLVQPPNLPIGEVWGDHTLDCGGRWRNAFTGEIVEGERLALREVLATFPVAMLERL